MPITENQIISRLGRQKGLYSPLEVLSIKETKKSEPSVKVAIAWQSRRVEFRAVVKARTAPKLVREGLIRLRSYANKKKSLLIVPYLSKAILEMLENEGVSGLDLSGNYWIRSPEIVAIRLDQKNQYRESQPIKKIFSGNSSLVGRLFLSSKRRFDSVNEVWKVIKNLGGNLSLSATSKVLSGMEEELMIEKDRKGILLLQPDKLLQRLEEDYRPPKVTETVRLKIPEGLKWFAKLSSKPWVLSGESSAECYAVTTPSEISTIYTNDFGPFETYKEERFYNIVLKKTDDSFPYFDVREKRGIRWSSPVQCYLELSRLDKREQELATSVRKAILENLK